MAAAHRTRRKTQLPKRRKQTAIKKPQRRRLLPKRRKPQLNRRKPQSKRGKLPALPKPVVKRPHDEVISKVLRQLNRDKVCISTKAKGKMISFIRRLYNNVSKQAKCSSKSKRSSATISSKELQNALKRVMRKDQAMKLVRTIRKVSCHRRH